MKIEIKDNEIFRDGEKVAYLADPDNHLRMTRGNGDYREEIEAYLAAHPPKRVVVEEAEKTTNREPLPLNPTDPHPLSPTIPSDVREPVETSASPRGTINIYGKKHVFVGQTHVANVSGSIVTVLPQYADMVPWLRNRIPSQTGRSISRVTVGDAVEAAPVKAKPLPPEARKLMKPELGEFTPEVVDWARKNLSDEDFSDLYRGKISKKPDDTK